MRVGLGDVGRRLGVLALLILTLVYPVRAWFLLSELPWGLKAASLARASTRCTSPATACTTCGCRSTRTCGRN